MYGQPPRFSNRGGGRGQHPPQQPPQPLFNPNYHLNNYYHQPSNFPIPFPFFAVENPSFHSQNFNLPIANPNFRAQNPSFDVHGQVSNNRGTQFNGTVEKIDKAVVKARRELIAAGENVSALKVSQAVLVVLEADSWDSLGVQMQQVPSLYQLMLVEGKVNAFINCFVGVWKITTLSDLETAICKNEGVQQFEELELGPLIRHPLVNHYFCVSSDSSGVFRISSQEILNFLVEFMDTHKGKEVKADELLDFIAEKRSVDSKEKLHVRIQSLGLHISFILKARPMENATIKKYLSAPVQKNKKRPLFTSQKKQLDESFSVISERMKSFPLERGKHIRFQSSSSEDDDDNDIDSDDEDETCLTSQSKNSSQDFKNSDRVGSCPYPSATEEKTRLGIISNKENTTFNEDVNKSNKKRKSDAIVIDCTSSASCKFPKRDGVRRGSVGIKIKKKVRYEPKDTAMSLDHDSTLAFIVLWKDVCKRKNVLEALKQILGFYKVKVSTFKKVCKSEPLVGLINVAIRSIKRGMWDSMYDTFQLFEQQEPVADSEGHAENVTIQTEQVDGPLVTKHVAKQHCEVSLEDILKKVSDFLKDNHDVMGDVSTSLCKNAIFLRNLYKCEAWLTRQLAVENFESFGYGDFLTFLERNVSALPSLFQKYFVTDGTHNKSSVDACMSHELLNLLVAQASHNLSDNEHLTIQNVVELLARQFPLIPFKMEKEGSLKSLEDTVKANKSNPVFKSVLFSAALLSHPSVNDSSETQISSKKAIEVLLSAPMLTDLYKWSHWDVLFAPSLGPLSIWLLNQTNTKDLLCLVTRSGSVIRIDQTATVDSFLEASIQGSSFRTAVNLLSLFAFYGGEKNVPSSLLKCHVEKAFKVIVNNDLSKHKSQLNDGISRGSIFILDCLAYLPKEFHCFATELLLSGFRSVVKEAPLSVLSQCRNTEDRLMLHEIGFSLGIVEWIDDYSTFSLTESSKSTDYVQEKVTSTSFLHVKKKEISSSTKDHDVEKEDCKVVSLIERNVGFKQNLSTSVNEDESTKIIECIRRDEFGLDSNMSAEEDSILKKQHARLGRALHCLSQELYSQDSHFLLELVQNADDNVYPCDVEPTLTFILQEEGVIVLNNEQGFSIENIKALCDVGNSTKKEPSAGYIGKKGIGFKSVFRVTDAPEIHSNGFHIKFDISAGQIGFVLPTVVPPCDINLYSKLVSTDNDPMDEKLWNTCIVLPFRSNKNESFSVENLISMFSDLHPSLLLFLHRLECIKFRNLINDSFITMRKEVVGDDIVSVSLGKEKMTWFVKSCQLQANHIRHDVKTTEISMALMLNDLNNGDYIAKLEHQPVFAFLPLRNYGLKFIIQADFILPSSREEVDGDSPWNQWLLSEFPNLFVNAEVAFCNLPCFKENPAKGVSVFLSFVPLGGEVHGFFSCLPRMIISKLRMSNCLLLEGDNEWVPPCKVLRNWTEQTRSLLPDSLIKEHLGVGYLNKDLVLTDSLSCALGIEDCGPKVLIQIMTSVCRAGSLKSMGFNWVSSWLNVMYLMSVNGTQSDVISLLAELPFIPLLDGTYAAINDGAIWLHTDNHGLEAFGNLYPTLRVVNPSLFNDSSVENVTNMLYKIGVQRLSAHEVLKVHILPAISNEKVENLELMIEYLSFILFHLESSCSECALDKEHILLELHNNAFISTNHGYKRLADVSIHFGNEFGNPIDMSKLINGTDMKWFEIDIRYLNHSVYKSETLKWRKFLQELGVTDFVRVCKVEKKISDIPHTVLKNMMLDDDCISSGSAIIKDYDSEELMELLSHVSLNGDREKGKYLLEVLDTLWDEVFSNKITGFCSINGQNRPFKSSVLRTLSSGQWLASSIDDKLHFPKDLFQNCETVHAVLGDNAPYAIPKVKSIKLLNDLGLKNTVTLDDALSVLEVWRRSEKPFRASISQMSKLYTYIWNEMSISKQKIVQNLHSQDFIFVPYSFNSTHEVASGSFLPPNEVYWHDSTGSMEQTRSTHQFDQHKTHHSFSKMLCNVYPGLHYFFVKEFGVAENPPLLNYLHSLLQLSTTSLPSQEAKTVFQVLKKWSDGLESGLLSSDDIDYLKKNMEEKEMKILPTVLDKWVSLHQSFGLICWCDDEELKKEFKKLNNVDFLFFGELDTQEKQILEDKVSVLFQRLGIPSLSEVVTREAIYYGPTDSSFKTSLVSWALPYAQRYIYNIHPNEYSEFKLTGFKTLNSLKIVVVEKLLYKNIIKKFGIKSKKRYECSCLLQDNILYATRESDTHSLYMELSRFLVSGIPELPLANFLHMITTMAESGSTEVQMELFITNSQKLLKLPSEESQWSISSTSAPEEEKDTPTTSSGLSLDDSYPPKPSTSKKFGTNSSWPPVNWKTAPGFECAVRTQAFNPGQMRRDATEGFIVTDADWTIEENPASTIPSMVFEEHDAVIDQSDYATNMNVDYKSQPDHAKNTESSYTSGSKPRTSASNLIEKDQLYLGAVTPQQIITGRTGEFVAFKYFSSKIGEKCVKWVNEVKESGLPYDIVVEGKDNKKEYIEVKSTSNARKDWFVVTVREWQFAVEKGESFSIARVVLSEGKSAQITTYRNPVKLCQSGNLQLAILASKQ